MPDILLRNMEMPKSCKACPVFEQSLAFPDYIKRCRLGADLPQPWPLQYEKCGDNCPLHELPPHGDLIDRKALFDEVFKVWGVVYSESDCNTLMDLINDAPVIIPASEEENNT